VKSKTRQFSFSAALRAKTASGNSLQPFLGKGAAGGRLQITFKFDRPLAVRKGHCCLDPSRAKLGSVWNSSRIVSFQTGSQMLCEASVKTFRGCFALKNVNVEELHALFFWRAES
jgi:hypothetical protein